MECDNDWRWNMSRHPVLSSTHLLFTSSQRVLRLAVDWFIWRLCNALYPKGSLSALESTSTRCQAEIYIPHGSSACSARETLFVRVCSAPSVSPPWTNQWKQQLYTPSPLGSCGFGYWYRFLAVGFPAILRLASPLRGDISSADRW
jgi:hypothetical protein